jgi:hypothetical protein
LHAILEKVQYIGNNRRSLFAVVAAAGGLMSDAAKLPVDQQAAAMASISADGLPAAIERQAAAGEHCFVYGNWVAPFH